MTKLYAQDSTYAGNTNLNNVHDNNDEIIYMSNFPMLIACKGTSRPVCILIVLYRSVNTDIIHNLVTKIKILFYSMLPILKSRICSIKIIKL